MIKWDTGLDVNVKKIDQQHKSLLNSISRLSFAIDNNESSENLMKLFNSFEEELLAHFQYEEQLLKKCNYPDFENHQKEHQKFSEDLSELKKQLLNSKSYMESKEVVLELTDAIISNIIEDAASASCYNKCGISENLKNDDSPIQKLITKTINTFSFSKRLILSAIIPLIGMMILAITIIHNNYTEYQNVKQTSSISLILSEINQVTHNLQIERGLSCAFVTSIDEEFTKNLKQHSLKVDNSIKKLKNKLNLVNIKKTVNINKTINLIKSKLNLLESTRTKINKKEISVNDIIKFYSNIINNIIKINTNISILNNNKKISSSISTLSSLLYYKESLGLQRAYGIALINKKDSTSDKYYSFIKLLGVKETLVKLFKNTATKTQINNFEKYIDTKHMKILLSYENNILNKNFENLKEKIWFNTTTANINNIYKMENELLANINKLIKDTQNRYFYKLVLWMAYIIIILIIVQIILYLFYRSSQNQIQDLTKAMKHLASGGRNLRLMNSELKDEIAQLHDAYEITRQELLKGDILTQLYLVRKEVEIKNQQIQNDALEELASTDPLTGCINRRKFEELSNLELQRSTRYKSNLSFLMLDIDHFKNINDTYGHATGDTVLKHFSSACLNLARDIDIVARVGGEEFVVMLPETDANGAFIFAERFRKEICNSEVIVDKQIIKYTVSIGISVLDTENDTDVSMILHRADLALYSAKETGRNKSVIYNKEIS